MAKKDIWMPLNIGDYLADTMSLTAEQHGVYLLLLMDYWKSGPLADDDRQLAATGKVPLKAWKAEIGPVIRSFFFKGEDNHLHQKRADIEIAKTGRISEARRNAAFERHGGKRETTSSGEDRGRDARAGRMRLAKHLGKHSEPEWRTLLTVCGNVCLKCGASDRLTKDHVIPIQAGGSDSIDNLQPLCRPCNSEKGVTNTDYRPNGWQDSYKSLANDMQMQSKENANAPQEIHKTGDIARVHALALPSPLEKKETSLREAKKIRAKPRSVVPPDWTPDDVGIAFAQQRGVVKAEVSKFINFHTAKGNLMADWNAAWRTWCENAVSFGTAKGVPQSIAPADTQPSFLPGGF